MKPIQKLTEYFSEKPDRLFTASQILIGIAVVGSPLGLSTFAAIALTWLSAVFYMISNDIKIVQEIEDMDQLKNND
jgi:hypothetical protein